MRHRDSQSRASRPKPHMFPVFATFLYLLIFFNQSCPQGKTLPTWLSPKHILLSHISSHTTHNTSKTHHPTCAWRVRTQKTLRIVGLTWSLVPRRHKEVSDGQAGYQRHLGRALPEGQFWEEGSRNVSRSTSRSF